MTREGDAPLRAALGELYRRIPLGMRLGLEPMRDACARAGSPERGFAAVHVAGTNGKGSTSAMIEAIARASGLRTGLYTSPHLCRFAERIRLDGEPVDDAALTSVLRDALRLGDDLSFFETATLAAFLAFRAAGVDLAVIEVGIGGRLDATNVIPPPRCAALTNVAFDHQDRLGSTLAAIAREKAAIAKPGVPFVVGALADEARRAAIDVATAHGAAIVEAELPPDVDVGLAGLHQRKNAAVAWAVAGELGLAEDARRQGLREARWPGRLEIVDVGPSRPELRGRWLLDGAHNPDGAAALVAELTGVDCGALVFGALEDKAWREMAGIFAAIDAPRVYVRPGGRSPADPAALAAIHPGETAASVPEALALARRLAGERVVVVAGSLYLVGEARAQLLGLPVDPIVAL